MEERLEPWIEAVGAFFCFEWSENQRDDEAKVEGYEEKVLVLKGKQIKNKTKSFFFDGREARAVDRSGKGFFCCERSKVKSIGKFIF
ncbi:hypothetical protein ABE17_02270 [Bacillus mycoides]|jgi:hypothetical protein|nr:hypothetical protein [Bacillus mycoides]MBG9595764.1 hypothetical protein [Bacillus mycoides]MBG9720556.1 hypothetical protein [Bacillus mycoides]MCD4646810.1 hypothetical protein [Bacillus mycoides]MDR4900650.1 hypothetical protein [Bacillus mycoides]PGA06465.1 hypothetical protein COL71_24380 [Bacillus mycoides]